MCGIAGLVWRGGAAQAEMSRMLASLAHRGPDGEGTWHNTRGPWHVTLGHRRLSIIDIEGGAQPMALDRGQHVITYNGETYNYEHLRAPLSRTRAFETASDTEVVAAHVAANGARGLTDLSGMFAFGLWDQKNARLLLARDRAGVKPLYYASLAEGGIAFASELSALLTLSCIPRVLSRQGVQSYLFSGYAQPPYTLIDGVKKLPQGCYLEWKDGRASTPTPYWEVPSIRPASMTLSARTDKTWDVLRGAAEECLVSDVPVGVFLSGGIDSSIAALQSRLASGQSLKAFTIAFKEPSFDESAYAKQVAGHLGLEHIVETLSVTDAVDIVQDVLPRLDEPMADASLLPTYLLARLAAKHVKVVIGGDGGDELWAGYPTYLAHRVASSLARIPRPLRQSLTQLVKRLPIDDRYQSMAWKMKRFFARWDDNAVRRHLRWMSVFDLPALEALAPGLAGAAPTAVQEWESRDMRSLTEFLALDFHTFLPGSVLTKVDRATMLCGLEARPLFLTNESIDWAFSTPDKFKLRGSTGKYLLKEASKAHLPHDVVFRRKKGFGIPLAAWVRGPFGEDIRRLAADSPLWDGALFSAPVARRLTNEHLDRQADHAWGLWALYVLDSWMRQWGVTL